MQNSPIAPLGQLSAQGTSSAQTSHDRDDAIQTTSEWTWAAAEDRLRDAFEEGGIVAWAECALRELEAEVHQERRRRGL